MKKIMKIIRPSFLKCTHGSISVETALVLSVVSLWSLGVLDFGLAFARQMELTNAARAGMQYAIVRRPIDGDYSAIINAVNVAAPRSGRDGTLNVNASMYCTCPDGSSSICLGISDQDLSCPDGSLRSSFIQIDVSETHSLMFGYPGIGSEVELSRTVVARLN